MCGIYGIIDKSQIGVGDPEFNIFSQMGTLTELRGRHSSGCFSVDADGSVSPVVKTVGPSVNLLFDKAYEKFKIKGIAGRALIGHGRWATVGKVNKQNAHPFRENEFTLVHNGTIRSGLDIKEHNVEVDSHGMVKAIAEKGLKEAIGDLSGAWAIILYDNKKKQIQILRNHERELHYLESNNLIYIMSEKEALEYLAARNKIYTAQGIKSFKANTLYTFDVETLEMVEGEVVEGNRPKFYAKTGQAYPAGLTNFNRGSSHGGHDRYKYTHTPSSVVGQAAYDSIKREYEIGENVEFHVDNMTWINGQCHFTGHDVKGNKVHFVTGNTESATTVRKGDIGVGMVVAVGLDFQTKTATYTVRYREIVWDKVEDGGTNADKPVVTYGGETFPKGEWAEMCRTQQCWSCQGAIDESDPASVVAVRQGALVKLYCGDCVEGHSASCLNNHDKQAIQQQFSRFQ